MFFAFILEMRIRQLSVAMGRHAFGLHFGRFTNISERLFSTSVGYSEELLKIQKIIKENTCITRSTLTPEIALHLITPSCPLWFSPLEKVPFEDPFWAFYWPGGQALARYILDYPDTVSGQRVLDIGSGCGASAIAAAMSNADHVTASDIDPVAGYAISLNCALNNVDVTICTENLIGKCENIGDCILVGDMFYDDQFAEIFISWLQLIRMKGKHVFVGDPGRMAFIKHEDKFQCLALYSLGPDNFSSGFSQVSIWRMK